MTDDSNRPVLERWRRQEQGGAFLTMGFGALGLVLAGLSRHPNFGPEEWSITKAALIVGGCLFVCWLGYRGLASLRARKPVPPGAWIEPFVPVVRSEGKRGAIIGGLVGAIVFGGGGATALYFALADASARTWIPAILGLLAGAGSLAYAVHQFVEQRRFGRAELRLTAAPSPGKPLIAELVLENAPHDLRQVTARLECKATHWELREKREIDARKRVRNPSTSTAIEWDPESESVEAIEQTFAVASSATDARCLIQIPLRADLPPTDARPIFAKPQEHAEPGARYHQWSLSVTGDVAGVDLARTFALAVQK